MVKGDTVILDHINNARLYESLHPDFRTAFNFLIESDLAVLPDGRHDIDGDACFVVIARSSGRGRDGAKLEVHRKYIDIQFAIAGTDEIGWKPTPHCNLVDRPFDDAKDVALFVDSPDAWVALPPEAFAIFFPEDAHAPLGGQGHLHKAVVKLRV